MAVHQILVEGHRVAALGKLHLDENRGIVRKRWPTGFGWAMAPPEPLSIGLSPRQSRWTPLWPVLLPCGPNHPAAKRELLPLPDKRLRFEADVDRPLDAP